MLKPDCHVAEVLHLYSLVHKKSQPHWGVYTSSRSCTGTLQLIYLSTTQRNHNNQHLLITIITDINSKLDPSWGPSQYLHFTHSHSSSRTLLYHHIGATLQRSVKSFRGMLLTKREERGERREERGERERGERREERGEREKTHVCIFFFFCLMQVAPRVRVPSCYWHVTKVVLSYFIYVFSYCWYLPSYANSIIYWLIYLF